MSAEIYSFETGRYLGKEPVRLLGKLVTRAERAQMLFQEVRTLIALKWRTYTPDRFVDKGDRLLTEAANDGLTYPEIENAYILACQGLASLGCTESLNHEKSFDFKE